ncbi:helix-turn-helix domain-containing protein [Liquorilactobacillus nagelii]|uniref:helix-turn-helix domain-containing protein n=1 Tax=Liquorilactobacillus nagelii TaxID=82688 RepID=UPI0039EC221C
MTFGQKLRALRLGKKMTQEDLGKLLNVSKVSISGYENDTREPDKDSIRKLAEFFGISTDYLLGVDSSKNKKKIDINDEGVIMTFEGKEIPPEDIEIIKRVLRGGRSE